VLSAVGAKAKSASEPALIQFLLNTMAKMSPSCRISQVTFLSSAREIPRRLWKSPLYGVHGAKLKKRQSSPCCAEWSHLELKTAMLCINGAQLLVVVHLRGMLKQPEAKHHTSLRPSRDQGQWRLCQLLNVYSCVRCL